MPGSARDTAGLARTLAEKIGEGSTIAVHCRAGIGRSSLIAACVLAVSGTDPDAAFALIAAARGVAVPDTMEQRDWVAQFRASAMTRDRSVSSSGSIRQG